MRVERAMGRRGLVLALLTAAALVLGAGPAAAELVVVPDQVEPGAREVTLTFRVTEDDPAARPVRLQVFLPTGRPLVGVRAPAPPGWTSQLSRAEPATAGPVGEIVTGVDWTATGPAPAVVELPLLVDRMPDGAGPVRFRALLTDAAGRTEEWSNTWAEGGPKPAHDALLVRFGPPPPPPVEPATHGDHHGEQPVVATAAPASPDAVATTLIGAALLAGALAAVAGALGRRQRRRFEALTGRPAPAPPEKVAR